ncbi:hypothetical protein M9H77_14067 [Catharanthus roseus]|uniref:Uncharacterized protein n=1 Tax=Catharanthus roseus TaxID=4058 RepID=A0ACC0BM58_CATRO|nr:hypothetical protein M9H77_14067 [Catharanthus roseus]
MDDGRRILLKGISLTGNTSSSHIGRYLGQVAVQVHVLILVLVEKVGRLVAVGVGAEDIGVGLCINLYKTGRMWLEMVIVVLGLYQISCSGTKNHWVEIRRRMSYDLQYRMHVYEQLFGSVERMTELIMQTNWEEDSAPPKYWMNTPDHLYIIANTFNLCVVFLARSESTTVLPLVSNMDGPSGTIVIGFIEELQHFIQMDALCPHYMCNGNIVEICKGNYRDIIANGNIPGILNPRVSAGEVSVHVIISTGTRWNGQDTSPCLCQTWSGMYGSKQSKYAMNLCHVEKPNNQKHPESCTVSTEPHQLSSYPASSEYPTIYSYSCNRSSETSACRACILRKNV